MLNAKNILSQRLIHQQISHPCYNSVKEVVSHMGALQAQDYAMSKWAIGVRLPGATDAAIEEAIDKGHIIRTHLLRPTWHWVAAADLRWIMELTAPQIHRIMNGSSKELELDATLYERSNKIIAKALENNKQLTRTELMARLAKEHIVADGMRAAHLMLHAELSGIVCNGSRRGSEFTYALMDNIVPQSKTLHREEALARLALRYFTARGPATLADFVAWSGLSQKDAKTGLDLTKEALHSEVMDDMLYWMPAVASGARASAASVYLLPAFDEWIIGYKDRSATMDAEFARNTITLNGIFKPTVIVNGKVAGTWKRTLHKQALVIEPTWYIPLTATQEKTMYRAAEAYAVFLEAATYTVHL